MTEQPQPEEQGQTQSQPSHLPATPQEQDLAPLNIIRTETVLSKLPIHNLAKKGSINVRIIKKNDQGQIELLWKISPSRDHGEPRQLAYKLDTIVINRRLDELGRPLPKIIPLGSWRQICRDLGLQPTGQNIDCIKKSLLQNAFAGITAILSYKSTRGTGKRLGGERGVAFTRYSVRWYGDQLPNGQKADGVYVVLNPEYWEILNDAPVRPLNYDYLKELPPAAQRFYEIVSYKIFAALNNRQPEAKLPYSEFCLFSAQQRYYELWKVKRQMTPIHRRHLESGYLKALRYEEVTDAEGMPDWDMFYTPGPKARAEYAAFMRRSQLAQTPTQTSKGPDQRETIVTAPPTSPDTPSMPGQGIDRALVAQLTRRGITPSRAQKLLSNLAPGQEVTDQLEWGDHVIAQNPQGFRNPPGFYVSLIRDNVIPPATFENDRRRRLREERERAYQQWLFEEQQVRFDYDRYREEQKERYIKENLTQEHYQQLLQAKKRHFKRQYPRLPDQTLTDMAHGAIRGEIEPQVTFLSFEDWKEQRVPEPAVLEGYNSQ